VICDIWKDNKNLKQLNEVDLKHLMITFKKFGTRQVTMSGGEALLNPNFFRLCMILKRENIRISLLSTGLGLKIHVDELIEWVDDVIISLDGPEKLHDAIRNVPGAFRKMRESVRYLKSLKPDFLIRARTVIHRLNYRSWDLTIENAKDIGFDQISFLPADISSSAFNRKIPWDELKQNEILIPAEGLPALQNMIHLLLENYRKEFENHFIAESPAKIQQIYQYYSALHGMKPFPFKKCNAPWVSTVIEADGTVRPCFFHEALGNIHQQCLSDILNSPDAIHFRKSLDTDENEICKKCVCHLNLPLFSNLS
jgi:MoaA/NifB/PqqE/SkfB family radical SAM enzyme